MNSNFSALGGAPPANDVPAASHRAGDFGTVPTGFRRDPIERLSEAAAAKLRRLREQREDAGTIARSLSERWMELHVDLQTAQRQFREFEQGVAQMPARNVDGAWYERARAERQAAVDSAKTELDAQKARQDRHQARLSPIPERLTDWLRALGSNRKIEPADKLPAPKLGKSETIAAAVERVRDELAQLRADLKATVDAPVTVAAAKAAMVAEIDKLAKRGAPILLHTAEKGLPVQFRALRGDISNIPDALGFIAWMFRDQVIERFSQEIEELADEDAALTDAERARRERSLLERMLNTERQEEALIELAESQGLEIIRRENADPRAVLGLSSDLSGWQQ